MKILGIPLCLGIFHKLIPAKYGKECIHCGCRRMNFRQFNEWTKEVSNKIPPPPPKPNRPFIVSGK